MSGLLLALALLVVGVVLLRVGDASQLRRSLLAVDLRFPRQLDEAGVQAFLGAVSGFLPPWWRRWWHTPFIALEIHADHRGTRHRLLVPRPFRRWVETALSAHLPAVHYEVREGVEPVQLDIGAEYRLTDAHRSLATEAGPLSARLLTSLQPLRRDEYVVVQWLLAAARPVAPARLARSDERGNELFVDDGVVHTSEAVAALKKKHDRPLLIGCPRIGVKAASTVRRRALLRDVESTWHATRAPGTLLKRRLLGRRDAARRLTSVWVPINRWPVLINSGEASALVGFPVEARELAGLELTACPPMVVPREVSSRGTVLGEGTHPRSRRPVALGAVARRHHLLLIGSTGSGKSTSLTHLARADATNGDALIVIDPKDGELIRGVIEQLPEQRLSDVIVLDPTDAQPVGFDPLRSTAATRELVVDRVLGLMVDIWKENLGPRSADILRHTLLTIAAASELRLTEVPLLLTDATFRRRVLRAHDPGVEVRTWWTWVDGLSTGEWTHMTQAPLNKLRAAVGRSVIADTVGQPTPAIDFNRVLRERQILLVRLPVGLLGDETTALLGAMLINQLWSAIAARANLPVEQRGAASVIIDEVGTVLRFPANTVEAMLSQARGYHVAVTLAAQGLPQLPTEVRAAALTNARTKLLLACGRDDAGVFARELGHGLTADQIVGIEAFQAIAAVHANGRTQRPATIRLAPPAEPVRAADVVYQASRERWGVTRDELREARTERQRRQNPAAEPIGRRKRPAQ